MLFFWLGVWDKALAAADFDVLPVRPSFSTLDAAVAALGLVTLTGELFCDRALAAAVFDFPPVAVLASVFPALLAAVVPVTFLHAILFSLHFVNNRLS
ncbi:MAG: hypothetical protein H3C30_07265 [Candidatus Hydrogenedentes bacterium]|nr:hypothetical protein [Candidatus Hydrogenedentota bacterium]